MILVIIIFITIIIIIVYLIKYWSLYINNECDNQDINNINGIPSYHNAWDSNNITINQLHKLILLNHDLIYDQLNDTLEKYEFEAINDIYIRFSDKWTDNSDKIPILKDIASLFPNITNLYISIINPGDIIINNIGVSRIYQKYQYGLQIPYSDIGLNIKGYDINFIEKNGFVWDNTLPNTTWNHTLTPRILIVADVIRNFSFLNRIGAKFIHKLYKI
jgi:hypothetical protein